MKRTIYNYIILTIATMLLAACSQDTLGELYSGDDETTTISFTLGTPAWTSNTRAGVAGDDAAVKSDGSNLQLLCFDANGGFIGIGKVQSSTSAIVLNGTRHIHFLLNYTTTTFTNTSFTIGTNEKTVLTSLKTTASSDASVLCWGYISDLSAYKGEKVPLIRNVAKIVVKNNDTEKTNISNVAVVAYNDYTTGSVAPFDSKNLSNPFNSDNYSNGVPQNFTTIPLKAERQNTDGVSAMGTTDNVFVYECDQTAGEIGVIVAVTYNDNKTRYHKICLCNKYGDLYTIVRNHQYTININSDLPKSSGESSLAKAIAVTSTYATNMITIDDEIPWSAESLSFVTNSGGDLSEITLYPELDMTDTENFPVKEEEEAITKTVKFKYLGSSTDVTTSSFTVTSSVKGVTAEVTSYADHVGELEITVPYTNLSNAGTITLSYGNASDELTINKGTWTNAFTGTISYYSQTSDGTKEFKITDFSLSHESETSGTNLRIASKYIVPSSSSSTFNNAYIATTPISDVEYWYNKAKWESSDLTDLLNQLTYTGTTEKDVYVMADGIKPCKVTWENKGQEPAEATEKDAENSEYVLVFTYDITTNDNATKYSKSITMSGVSYKTNPNCCQIGSSASISFKTGSDKLNLTINFASTSNCTSIYVTPSGGSKTAYACSISTLKNTDTIELQANTTYTIQKNLGSTTNIVSLQFDKAN